MRRAPAPLALTLAAVLLAVACEAAFLAREPDTWRQSH